MAFQIIVSMVEKEPNEKGPELEISFKKLTVSHNALTCLRNGKTNSGSYAWILLPEAAQQTDPETPRHQELRTTIMYYATTVISFIICNVYGTILFHTIKRISCRQDFNATRKAYFVTYLLSINQNFSSQTFR